jgi:RNA recognition motif-containing protein
VQGTLAQRKIKVRNIDARVVSVQDLKKLFCKCGPLINATFDTNEFGSYLGTATVIYLRASSANRAIKDYNLAQIDNRTMKVEFAMGQQQTSGVQNN